MLLSTVGAPAHTFLDLSTRAALAFNHVCIVIPTTPNGTIQEEIGTGGGTTQDEALQSAISNCTQLNSAKPGTNCVINTCGVSGCVAGVAGMVGKSQNMFFSSKTFIEVGGDPAQATAQAGSEAGVACVAHANNNTCIFKGLGGCSDMYVVDGLVSFP